MRCVSQSHYRGTAGHLLSVVAWMMDLTEDAKQAQDPQMLERWDQNEDARQNSAPDKRVCPAWMYIAVI
jgi:hypothetical protein